MKKTTTHETSLKPKNEKSQPEESFLENPVQKGVIWTFYCE